MNKMVVRKQIEFAMCDNSVKFKYEKIFNKLCRELIKIDSFCTFTFSAHADCIEFNLIFKNALVNLIVFYKYIDDNVESIITIKKNSKEIVKVNTYSNNIYTMKLHV